jgi:multidrug efflux pump subunit AcrA (membrane-fusion protein)
VNTLRLLRPSLATLALTLTAAAGGLGCGGEHNAPGGGAMPPMPVKIATAATVDVDDFSDYLASIRSRRSIEVRPQVEGHVAKILVRPGDRVAELTPLLQIDPSKQQAAVSSASAAAGFAQAEVERARATLAQVEAARSGKAASLKFAEDEAKRSDALLATNVISQQAHDQTHTALETAKSDLESLDRQIGAQRAAIRSYERGLQQSNASAQAQNVELQYYRVTAPFAGTVGDIPVKLGELVTPSTLLTTLDDERNVLEANVSVPAEEASKVSTGLAVRLLDPAAKVLSEGKVIFVSPRIDESTQSVLVKAELPASSAFRSQQFVRARVVYCTHPGLKLPISSVSRMNGQSFVFVVVDGNPLTVAQTPVKLGAIQGDDVVVLDGLKPGQRYAASGLQKLRDKAPIAPQAAPAAPAAAPAPGH